MSLCLHLCDNYQRDLQHNIVGNALKGAVITFALKLFQVSSYTIACVGAGMAALATLIHTIMHPIFVNILPRNLQARFFAELIISYNMSMSAMFLLFPEVASIYVFTTGIVSAFFGAILNNISTIFRSREAIAYVF